jgi:hypothetical protein
MNTDNIIKNIFKTCDNRDFLQNYAANTKFMTMSIKRCPFVLSTHVDKDQPIEKSIKSIRTARTLFGPPYTNDELKEALKDIYSYEDLNDYFKDQDK